MGEASWVIRIDDDTRLDHHAVADLRISAYRPEAGQVVLSVTLRASTATVVSTFPACSESPSPDLTARARALAADVAEPVSRAVSRWSGGICAAPRWIRGNRPVSVGQVFAVT